MDRRYIPLRAAAPANDYGDGPLGLYEPLTAKRRRVGVSIACNTCRRKKTRCDGQRPICSNCASQNISCTYRDNAALSTESKKLLVEVMTILNSLPSAAALKVLASLTSENNAAVILSTLRNEAVLNEDAAVLVGHADITSTAFEFEIQNPIAYPETDTDREYPPLSPFQPDEFDVQPGQITNPFSRQMPDDMSDGAPGSDTDSIMAVSELCDPRLEDLDIRPWTRVPIDSSTAARCISLYMETDHPLLGPFDPDLFISHLVSGVGDYCSPLLVNALLYWASQMYGYIEPGTEDLATEFCIEAERLLSVERSLPLDSITSIAAVQFICLGYLGQGKDHAILSYVSEASAMGIRMGLFGNEEEDADNDACSSDGVSEELKTRENILPTEEERARMFAAWGVFNWITLMSLFYRQPGLFCPKSPPTLAIPEYGVSDTRTANMSQPRYMGSTFPHICRFWDIVHEVSVVYQADGRASWGSKSSLAFAEFKFRELLTWSNSLPPRLTAGNNHPHHVQVLHIWFHAIILDIFRPFTQNTTQNTRLMRTFTGKPTSAKDVCTASVAQLKYLIAEYRFRYRSSKYTLLWQTALIYVVNAILNDERELNWYHDLLLCVYAYQSLGRAWRVATCISKGLLCLALQKSDLSARAAVSILRDLERGGMKELTGDVRATFMADLNLALSDPKGASMEHLAREFKDNVWMKDLTTLFDQDLDN